MSIEPKTEMSYSENIYRVLYSSKIPKSRSPDDIESDLESILCASQVFNADNAITGVLVTNKQLYAQIIEGPARAVKDLIGHISCDQRHQDVRIISCHNADKRIFGDWSMGFVRTKRDLQTDAYMFPEGNGQSNFLAVSAFCTSLRDHVLRGESF